MPVVRVVAHDEIVDTVEVQLLLLGINDGLRDHLSIAVLRLDMFILVKTQVDITGIHDHRTRRIKLRRLGRGRRSSEGPTPCRWRGARTFIVRRSRGERLLSSLSTKCLALRA
jgi:hypothetical protein